MLWCYYSALNSHWNGTIGESRRWNSKWRGTIQIKSFPILVAISLHANRKTAITLLYYLLSTFYNCHFTCHARLIQVAYNNSRQTKWPSVADITCQQHGKTEDADFIATCLVNTSIHKNTFYTKRKVIL